MAELQNEPEWFKAYREEKDKEIEQLKKDYKDRLEQLTGKKEDTPPDNSDEEDNKKAALSYVESLNGGQGNGGQGNGGGEREGDDAKAAMAFVNGL